MAAHRLAVWAFLVNEGFLFGSILAGGLFLRFGGTVPWPRPGEALALGPVILATFILIASSATLNESLDALRRGNTLFCRRWLLGTALAGSVFLSIQAYEWWEVTRAATALAPGTSAPLLSNPWGAATFMQIFFLATGLQTREHVEHVLAAGRWRVGNPDITIVCERPKIDPHALAMRELISADLGIALGDVSDKATTSERLGFTGRGEGIAAQAVCLLVATVAGNGNSAATGAGA